MKTAKEIAQEPHGSWQPHDDCSCECECCGAEWQARYEAWIKAIQLDALKEGMTRAADVAMNNFSESADRNYARGYTVGAILTARDNLKLEDLK